MQWAEQQKKQEPVQRPSTPLNENLKTQKKIEALLVGEPSGAARILHKEWTACPGLGSASDRAVRERVASERVKGCV